MIENVWATYYYARDIQGSIRAVVNSAGGLVESYEYSPFGLMHMHNAQGQDITASTIGNPYGYTGQRWDAESALWHYKNRMYSAPLGRFLQRDPAGYVDGMNLYAYVRNNPLRYTDPEGLAAKYIKSEYVEPAIKNINDEYQSLKNCNYNRNIFNENISVEEAIREGWDDSVPAAYHQQGIGNEGNVKYISPDGHSEAIFDKNGQPVNDVVNGPTYNFADPRYDEAGHFIQDMIPYYIWGTSPDDPTKWYQRVAGTYKGPLQGEH